jgi:glutathione S-transferase
MNEAPITLFGVPMSLFTGKARSYLIKNDLSYQEIGPSIGRFHTAILPRAGGFSLPTIETAEGEVIRDGTQIVDHFEARIGHPATPSRPRQRVVNALLDVIGMEGLLRPAMHYRWNFDEENEAFIAWHFRMLAPAGRDPAEVANEFMGRMRFAAAAFGVTPETIPGVEARYLDFLSVLDRHFAESPYLLGGRPCTGDYSLIAPMYAHLGRDPKPLALMQAKAMSVFRWVERMNRPDADRGEYVSDGEARFGDAFFADDEVPETLVAVLRQIAIDFVPETIAAANFINDWLAQQAELPAGTPIERGLGLAPFEVDGVTIRGLAQPHRFYLLRRAQDAFERLSPEDRASVESLLDRCNLLPVLDVRLTREIRFQDNAEIWD